MKKIYIFIFILTVIFTGMLYGDEGDFYFNFHSMSVDFIEYDPIENSTNLRVEFTIVEEYDHPSEFEYIRYKIDDSYYLTINDDDLNFIGITNNGYYAWETIINTYYSFEHNNSYELTLHGSAVDGDDYISDSFTFYDTPVLMSTHASALSSSSLSVNVFGCQLIDSYSFRWRIDNLNPLNINDPTLIDSLINGNDFTLSTDVDLYDGNEHTFTIDCSPYGYFNEENTTSVSCIITDLPIQNNINEKVFTQEVLEYDPSQHHVGIHFTLSKGYTDGIGRKLQSISVKTSPDEYDIVTPYSYDFLGRQAKSYLPFVAEQNNGELVVDALNEQLTFYNTEHPGIPQDNAPFSEAKFEESPLNRVIEQGATGIVWQPDGNTLKNYLSTNQFEEVRKWNEDGTRDGFFTENELTVTETKDENHHSSFEYTDKAGKTILKKSINNYGSSMEELLSYYSINSLQIRLIFCGINSILKL